MTTTQINQETAVAALGLFQMLCEEDKTTYLERLRALLSMPIPDPDLLERAD